MIDVQAEFVWTVIWSYLSQWTFGLPAMYPSFLLDGAGLFFLLCITFYELRTSSVTNPCYWLKDYVADIVSSRKLKRLTWDRALLMMAVDCCGHGAGYWLYLKTLDIANQKSLLEATARPPGVNNVSYVYAFFVEVVVTAGTQLASYATLYSGMQPRLANLVSSFFAVYVLMIWAMPMTGGVMNPASSLAATFVSGRFVKRQLDFGTLVRVGFVHVSAPFVAAVLAGVVEGELEKTKTRERSASLIAAMAEAKKEVPAEPKKANGPVSPVSEAKKMVVPVNEKTLDAKKRE